LQNVFDRMNLQISKADTRDIFNYLNAKKGKDLSINDFVQYFKQF